MENKWKVTIVLTFMISLIMIGGYLMAGDSRFVQGLINPQYSEGDEYPQWYEKLIGDVSEYDMDFQTDPTVIYDIIDGDLVMNNKDLDINCNVSFDGDILLSPYKEGVRFDLRKMPTSLSVTPIEDTDKTITARCNSDEAYNYFNWETMKSEYSEPIYDEKEEPEIIGYDVKPQSWDYTKEETLVKIGEREVCDEYKGEECLKSHMEDIEIISEITINPTLDSKYSLTKDDYIYIDPTYYINVSVGDSLLEDVVCEAGGLFCHLNLTTDYNLTLYMPFDVENASSTGPVYDWSSNNYDGILNTNVSWNETSIFGGGYNFDGEHTNSNIEVDQNISGLCQYGCTWAAWVYPTDGTTDKSVASRYAGSSKLYDLFVSSSERITLYFGNDGTTDNVCISTLVFEGGDLITLNEWNFIAATWNGTNITLYRNYNAVNKHTFSCVWGDNPANPDYVPSAWDSGSPTYIGASDVGTNREWNGTLDEVMIFNKYLEDSEIEQLYLSQLPKFQNPGNHTIHPTNITTGVNRVNVSLTKSGQNGSNTNISLRVGYINKSFGYSDDANLSLYMPFEWGTGWGNTLSDKAWDISGSGNDGTLGNGSAGTSPTWNSTGGLNGTGGIEFDGLNQHIRVGTGELMQMQNSTAISTWSKTNGVQAVTWDGGIAGKYSDSRAGTHVYSLSVADKNIRGGVRQKNNTYINVITTIDASDGNWNYFVLNLDDVGKNISIYKNGVIVGSNVWDGTFLDGLDQDFFIGQTDRSFFNGTIDEVMVFNRSLSQAEITAIYNNQSQNFTAPVYTDYQNMTDGVNATFTISDNAGFIWNDFDYYADSNLFWSPVLNNSIIMDTYFVSGEAPVILEPVTDLVAPLNNSIETSNPISLIYNVTEDADNCTLIINSVVNATDDTITKDINQSWDLNFADGDYLWNVTCNASEFYNSSQTFNFSVSAAVVDTEYPVFSDYEENPSDPNTYSFGTDYIFNVSILSSNSSAWISFGSRNLTATNISNVYEYNVSVGDLGAGTHTYNWSSYGNGSSNLFNMSGDQTYTVSQAIPQGSITNDTNLTFDYNGEYTAIGLSESQDGDDDVTYIIYNNGVANGTGFSEATAGTYDIVLNTTGGVNWTANISMDTATLTISKDLSIVNLSLDNSLNNVTITAGETIDINCSLILGDTGEDNVTLYRNGTFINSGTAPIGNTTTFNSVLEENITCIYQPTQNYTVGSEEFFVNVVGRNVSIEHFDVSVEDFVFDSDTYVIILNDTIQLTEPTHIMVKGVGQARKETTASLSEISMRLTVGNDVLFDQAIITVNNLKERKVFDFPLNHTTQASGNITVLLEVKESGAGSVRLNSIEIHVDTNRSNQLNDVKHIHGQFDGSFLSSSYISIGNYTINKNNNASVLVDVVHTVSATGASAINCYLRNNVTGEVTPTYSRYLSSALDVGSTGINYINSNKTRGSETWEHFCKDDSSETIENNVSLFLYELADSGNNTIGSFQNNTELNGLTGQTRILTYSHKVLNGTEIEIAGTFIYQSTSGEQSLLNSPEIKINSSTLDEVNCSHSYNRSLSGNNDVATIKMYILCNDTKAGDTEIFDTYLTVASGETVNLLNASISGYEVVSLNTTTGIIPVGISITNPIDGASIKGDLVVNVTVSDPSQRGWNSNVSLLNRDGNFNLTLYDEGSDGNITGTINDTTGFSDGLYIIQWNATNIAGTSSDEKNITIDNTAPAFTNFTENPTDSPTYSSGATYRFSVNVSDAFNQTDTVYITFNNTNTTLTNITLNIYEFSVVDLAAATYTYNFTANDSLGNVNTTHTITYTIDQATSQTNLTFDKTSPQTYQSTIIPKCGMILGTGTPILTIDGNPITTGQPLDLASATYTFNCSIAENQNQTHSSNSSDFIINQKTVETAMSISGTSPITFGTASDFAGAETNDGDQGCTYQLFADDQLMSNPDNTVWGAGTVDYDFNTTGCTNYTSGGVSTETLTINKATGIVYTLINGSRSNLTIIQNHTANLSGRSVAGEVNIDLYNNGTLNVTGADSISIVFNYTVVGAFNITTISNSTQNYTSAFETWWVNVVEAVAPMIQINISRIFPDEPLTVPYIKLERRLIFP